MATYIALMNWTEEGVRNLQDAPERRRRVEALADQCGCKITANYLTMGPYDRVAIVEAPDDAAMARFALSFGRLGLARTTTLRAFEREEAQQILGSLS